jgi:hypothetical protein
MIHDEELTYDELIVTLIPERNNVILYKKSYEGHFIVDHESGLYEERSTAYGEDDDTDEIKQIVEMYDAGMLVYYVDTDLNTPTYESLNVTANDGAIHYTFQCRGRKLNPLIIPHRITTQGIEQLPESERNAIIEANGHSPARHPSCICEGCLV